MPNITVIAVSAKMMVDFSQSVNSSSTIRLLTMLERLYSLAEKIHIILDNAKYYLFQQRLRWDSFKKEFAILPIVHQSLVRSGWRILARNLFTGVPQELGFIETESPDRSLSNIFLPNGDYEVTVLTSSLFWKDASDRTVRTIAIHDDVELSPLPKIYHLRSSISQGKTTIQWSATPNGEENCLFALWYSSDVPVDTQQPPNETLWYFSNRSEYQTTFLQETPIYLTIAVMRPGNDSELGTKHELFLDWKTTPPRAPDDVMVFDPPLPAVDNEVLSRYQSKSDVILWQ